MTTEDDKTAWKTCGPSDQPPRVLDPVSFDALSHAFTEADLAWFIADPQRLAAAHAFWSDRGTLGLAGERACDGDLSRIPPHLTPNVFLDLVHEAGHRSVPFSIHPDRFEVPAGVVERYSAWFEQSLLKKENNPTRRLDFGHPDQDLTRGEAGQRRSALWEAYRAERMREFRHEYTEDDVAQLLANRHFVAGIQAMLRMKLTFPTMEKRVFGETFHTFNRLHPNIFRGLLIDVQASFRNGERQFPGDLRDEFPEMYEPDPDYDPEMDPDGPDEH